MKELFLNNLRLVIVKVLDPVFKADAFTCPYCGVFAKQDWIDVESLHDINPYSHSGPPFISLKEKYSGNPSGEKDRDFHFLEWSFSTCQQCKDSAVWVKEKLIYPKPKERPFNLPEVPRKLWDDYQQACLIVQASPPASAAMSRRCLQGILRDQGFKARSLAKEIGQAIESKSLPSYIVESIDAIRNIGNFAAHPSKDLETDKIVEVEPGEAEWNLDVIEALFDFYYVQPTILEKKRKALNKKLESIGKPGMKVSNQ